MATLLDQTQDRTDSQIRVSFPIVKFEEQGNDLLVYGKATDGSVDTDEQIVDPVWSAQALEKWLSTGGNVRVCHNPSLYPAGVGLKVEVDRDGDGGHWLKSLIVHDTAKELVKKGLLRAYSVGITRPVIQRDATGKARGGIIKGGEFAEISLVDRPANRNCGITLVKSEGVESPWTTGDLDDLLAKADSETVTKGDPVDEDEDPAETNPDPAEPNPDAETDDDDDMAAKMAWREARQEWLTREPALNGDGMCGTEYLQKRAAWQRWHDEGEQASLDEHGYPQWAAKKKLTSGERNALNDSDFAYIDGQGGRHLPVHDEGHVRSALGRFNQTQFESGEAKKKAARKIISRARDLDIDVDASSAVAQAAKTETPAVTKGMKDCSDCGASYDADSKLRRCPNCGAKLPKANKAQKASKQPLPADTQPAGEHREPDGTTSVEALEQDAGMPTDPDPVADKVPASVEAGGKKKAKNKGMVQVSYDVVRAHDACCAAYKSTDVLATYPALDSVADAINPQVWLAEASAATAAGKVKKAARLTAVAEAASALKTMDPAAVADGRAWLHKAFADMYPSTNLSPGEPPTPGRYQRPYLSAGHARPTAGANQTPRVPPSTHVPEPEDFIRSYLTAGHARPSPGDSGDNLPGANKGSGNARQYYPLAAREAARNALTAVHDHIAATSPDLCPMAASTAVMPPDMQAKATPHAVPALTLPKAPGEKTLAPTATKTTTVSQEPAVPAPDLSVIKALVAEETRSMRDDYETRLAALQRELDELGSQPDPAQAPVRGVMARKSATTNDEPAPVERRSLVDEAQQQAAADRAEQINWLGKMVKGHPDPGMRERYSEAMQRLLTSS